MPSFTPPADHPKGPTLPLIGRRRSTWPAASSPSPVIGGSRL